MALAPLILAIAFTLAAWQWVIAVLREDE